MTAPMTEQPIVLYDADCGFCRWSLAKLLAWDRRRRLRPVAIDSPEGERLLTGLSASERTASWHLVADAERYSAAAAAPPLLRELPGGRPLAAVLERIPAPTERAYAWVAGNRRRLGRLIPETATGRADAKIKRRERRLRGS